MQSVSHRIVIEAGGAENRYWRDLWRYRELLCFLAWRDLLVRYKQTLIGVAWAVVRPLLMILVFTFIFGKVAKLPSATRAPYPIMVLAGMLPWQFFATAIVDASNSLVNNSNLVSKVYFPRLIVPTGSVVTSVVDLLISFAILFAMLAWYHYWPDFHLLALAIFMLVAFGLAIACGFWLSALTVRYRDIRYVIPFLVQFGMYVSPVGFESSVIPDRWQLLYSLNPLVGIIDGFRWAILCGESPLSWRNQLFSVAWVALLGVTGARYFRQTERSFADVI